MNGMEDLNIFDIDQYSFGYDKYFSSPWASHIDIERRHKEIVKNMNDVMYENEDFRNRDNNLLALLSVILLLNTNGLRPTDGDMNSVEETQLTFVNMLRRYFDDKCSHKKGANKAFTRAIMIISLAREAHELQCQRLQLDWTIVNLLVII